MGNAIIDKSEALAVRIVRLRNYLQNEKQEYDMSRQLARSGTSIGANIAEAHHAVSDADFVNKLSIALKECGESIYWIKTLWKTDYLNDIEFDSINKDLNEVYALLISIIKSMKRRLNR